MTTTYSGSRATWGNWRFTRSWSKTYTSHSIFSGTTTSRYYSCFAILSRWHSGTRQSPLNMSRGQDYLTTGSADCSNSPANSQSCLAISQTMTRGVRYTGWLSVGNGAPEGTAIRSASRNTY